MLHYKMVIYLYALFILFLSSPAASTDILNGHSATTTQCNVPTTIQNGNIDNCQSDPSYTNVQSPTPMNGCTARCNPGYGPYGLNMNADVYCVQIQNVFENQGKQFGNEEMVKDNVARIRATREAVDPNCQPLIPAPQTKPDTICAKAKAEYKQKECCQKSQLPGWTNWTACSANCNGGTQVRFCHNPNNVTNLCNGPTQRECNKHACPWVKTCEDCRKHCTSKLERNVSMYELQNPKTDYCGVCPRMLCPEIQPVLHDIHYVDPATKCVLKDNFPNGGAPEQAVNQIKAVIRQVAPRNLQNIADNFLPLMAYVSAAKGTNNPHELLELPAAMTDKVKSVITLLNALRSVVSYPPFRTYLETTSFPMPFSKSEINGLLVRYVQTFNSAMDKHAQFSQEVNRAFLCQMWKKGILDIVTDANGTNSVKLSRTALEITENDYILLSSIYPAVPMQNFQPIFQAMKAAIIPPPPPPATGGYGF